MTENGDVTLVKERFFTDVAWLDSKIAFFNKFLVIKWEFSKMTENVDFYVIAMSVYSTGAGNVGTMVAFYGRSDDEMKKALMLIPLTMGVPRLGYMFLVDYTSNGGQVELSLSRDETFK
jgi:hypothetical protein